MNRYYIYQYLLTTIQKSLITKIENTSVPLYTEMKQTHAITITVFLGVLLTGVCKGEKYTV